MYHLFPARMLANTEQDENTEEKKGLGQGRKGSGKRNREEETKVIICLVCIMYLD